jgi:hypothetical protein
MMDKRIRLGAGAVGAFLLLAAARLQAEPWSLVSCDPVGAPAWQGFEAQMRAAKVGAPLYVPVPFPATSDQVVEDYLYQYRSVIKGMSPKTWQPNEARVQADLAGGKVTYQVLRVENWSVTRCRKEQKRDFYQLVRVFEPGGVEVARAVINDSGLMTTWINMPAAVPGAVASQSRALPPAAVAMTQLNAQLGIGGVDPEYVTAGGTLDCILTHPCLAFHQAGLSYIAFGDQLYEVSANGPSHELGKDVAAPGERDLLRSLATGERLISLGGKRFTVGRRVEPAMVRQGRSAFAQ